ncbi:phosphoglycerate mutase-like protein [Penicillium verhagenii]|uniref:phosphoglycerate mutase-like protein n=1 Tax=Penicillium verhagenii TaxID=1562060 RepID=UPI0025459DC0|nr:phosphoglycerate mutase-like protein [Penicillium verhagenii]KAJ5921029.1 phosphoglycerate mutase-like protein [Penicillium verhagenii]
MPPKLHLIRHAQGYHNLGPENWSLLDPELTEKGRQQCQELRREITFSDSIDLVVASPMRRAIHTGLEALSPAFEAKPWLKMIALPDLQEVSDFPCDIGTERVDLQRQMEEANLPVDLSLVDDDWTKKTGRYEPTREKIRARARDVRAWFKARPEKEIAVVSHGGFLHFLTEDWEDACKYDGTGWANAESRTYEFVTDGVELNEKFDAEVDEAPMQETRESRHVRGQTALSPTIKDQKLLSGEMLQGWANQGYPIE